MSWHYLWISVTHLQPHALIVNNRMEQQRQGGKKENLK